MNPTPTDAVGRLVAAPSLKQLAQTLARTQSVTASGLWGSSIAVVTAAVEKELTRPILLVCGHVDEAGRSGRRHGVLPRLAAGGAAGAARLLGGNHGAHERRASFQPAAIVISPAGFGEGGSQQARRRKPLLLRSR